MEKKYQPACVQWNGGKIHANTGYGRTGCGKVIPEGATYLSRNQVDKYTMPCCGKCWAI